MNAEQIMKIFADTAYIRTGGSPEELRTAQYLQDKIAGLGLKAEIVPFDVPMSRIQEAVLQVALSVQKRLAKAKLSGVGRRGGKSPFAFPF